jgi:hypothetical protein
MAENVERLQSELLDNVPDDAFPMTTSQLAAMGEEVGLGNNFFERMPERSFSSREEVIDEVRRNEEPGGEAGYGDLPADDSTLL